VKHLQGRWAALSIIASFVLVPAAMAQDAADFAAKIKSAYGSTGLVLELGAATGSGGNISFDGVSVAASAAAASSDAKFKLDTKLSFSGVTENADGSYRADALKFPDVDYSADGTEVQVKNITLTHIYVPNGKPASILDSSRLFGDASVGPISVVVDGVTVFSIDSIALSNSFKPAQDQAALDEIDSNAVTSGMKFDMSGAKDADAVAQAKALGLTTITGKALETLTWALKDGHLNASEISFEADKVGKFKFAFDITGYTVAFLQSLTSLQGAFATLSSNDSSKSAEQARATALLLNALQTLFLNSASVRFDDASITAKLIDFTAKQAGVPSQALIDQLVAQLPAEMDSGSSDQTPLPVLQMMQAAARAYLNNPHSIEVRLAPKTPLGVLGVVAAAMAPADLADQIGLQVLVNDKQITAEDAAKETGVTPPAPDSGDATPTPDNGDATPAPDNSDATPAPDNGDATTYPDSKTPAAVDQNGTDDNSGDDAAPMTKDHKNTHGG
jgi:hypothetical protein